MIIFKDFVLDIYKEGGISAAAKKLFMSQPALSISLKRLENDLGVTLFDRTTSPIQLTEAGKIYIETLNRVNYLTKILQSRFDDIKDLQSGNITVGAAHFITSFFLLNAISKFSETYPGISVNAVESNSQVLKDKLLNGEIDIVIDYDFDEEHFVSYPILTEKIFIAVPKKYQIKKDLSQFRMARDDIIKNKNIKIADSSMILKMFESEKFILMREGNNMEKYSRRILNKAEINPDVLLKTDQLITAFEAAIAGLGITFVTDSIINAIYDKDSLYYYNVGGESGQRTLYIAKNKNNYTSKATETFVKFCAKM